MPEGNQRLPDAAGRIQVIDALRGVAALSVLGFHLLRSSAQVKLLASTLQLVDDTFDYGRSGVAIFFVISGFVIAYTTRRSTGAAARPDGSLPDGSFGSTRRTTR